VRHAFNGMPLGAALCGIGIGRCLLLARGRRLLWVVIAVVATAQLAGNALAVREKTTQMARNGERASALLAQIEPFLGEIPAHGKLLLINPPLPENEAEYSIFLVHGFKVLQFGEHRLNQIAASDGLPDDFSVVQLDHEAVKDFPDGCCLALTLNPESWRVERAGP
jgi:hypothetical protein